MLLARKLWVECFVGSLMLPFFLWKSCLAIRGGHFGFYIPYCRNLSYIPLIDFPYPLPFYALASPRDAPNQFPLTLFALS